MNEELDMMSKRLLELANKAYHKNIPIYSDFLNLSELSVLDYVKKQMPPINVYPIGGYNLAERKIVCFIPDDFKECYVPPIDVLYISPNNLKFSEELTHRDYLGALVNLGIDRSKLGDIVMDGSAAYLFCHNTMSDYIEKELTRVKHTNIRIQQTEFDEKCSIHYDTITGTVSSVRLDSVIALAFNSSRSKLITYIEEGKVFVNGRLITTNSYNLHDEDIISVRGLGKFCYKGMDSVTKKGKYHITIEKYI